MKKINIMCIFIASLFVINTSFASNDTSISPVVKVVSYKNIFGKYIEELGRGSASVINKDGFIITNNHVVDDGNGNVSDYFNICLTKEDSKKPDCYYTATLINRDKDLDIAILKIDSKDIFGKNVDFSKLSFLDIDYNYDIKSQDDTFAVGYPGIGSETITKTKGIISGTTDYNKHKYIKSDTLISGGNSGGALLNKDGKLIGVPTFLVGGGYDPSIGYSISVKEVQDFITENLDSKMPNSEDIDNFVKNKIQLDKINNDGKIGDLLLNFSFSKDYEVKSYIKDKHLTLKPKLENEFLPSVFYIELYKTTNIKTEEDFLYYLEKNRLYYKTEQKLLKKVIGGIEFLYPIDIGDTTLGESSANNVYISRLGDDSVITISIKKPVFEDVDKNKIVKANIDKLLSSISFNKDSIKNIKFSFDLNSPKISILTGSVLIDSEGIAINYYGNLYDLFMMGVKEFLVDDGKGKTIEEIFKNNTLEIEDDYKSMITVSGHKGYIYCSNSDFGVMDEKGVYVVQNLCIINIYEGINGTNNKEYYLNGMLFTNKNKKEENLKKTIKFLEEKLILEEIGDGKTNIVNVFENIVPLGFKDIKYQSDDYVSVLKKLVKYKLLVNGIYLNPDKPIKWKEFVYNYFRYKYNYQFITKINCDGGEYSCLFKNNYLTIDGKKVSMFDLFKEINIPLDEYVDNNKTKVFLNYMDLKLAGINSDFSDEWFFKYNILSENSIFQEIKQKMDTFNNITFGKDTININKLLGGKYGYLVNSTFIQTKDSYFEKSTGEIIVKDLYKSEKYKFSSTKNDGLNNRCKENDENCYKVLTKSLMIDLLVPNIDFTIFDKSLKNQSKSVME